MDRKPQVSKGWIRVLVFIVIFFVLQNLFSTIYFFIAKFFLHKEISVSDLMKNSYAIVITSFASSLISVFISTKYIDRKSFTSIGISPKGYFLHGMSGFFLGITLLCAGVMTLMLLKKLIFIDIGFVTKDVLITLFMMLVVAFYEELVFRGYILNNLMQSFDKWVALLTSAFIFSIVHGMNPDIGFIALINIFLAGMLLGVNYLFTKNLWFAIALHFSWNFFQSILGFNVSGMPLKNVLVQELKGPEWLTGGKFGFEGSIVCTVILFIAFLLLFFYYSLRIQKKV